MNRLEEFEMKARMLRDLGCSYHEARRILIQTKADRKPVGEIKRFKDEAMNREKKRAAERKFKVAIQGGAKVSKAMSDTWDKRQPSNIYGFYDPKKAKAKP